MLDKDQFISKLKEKLKVVNSINENNDLVDFLSLEMADRLSLYLNLDTTNKLQYDERLVSISVRVVSSLLQEAKDKVAGSNTETKIQSISDNGQTITFSNIAKNYIATASDSELFGGVANILKPYRRCNVVS
nr:MAG TPA: tail connector protein [Caudoviricetes sp.]DAX99372.1 MAG TPA: tail connector protein [Caudoviricetes sp.]